MLRGFTDAGGTDWRVWQVLPSPLDGRQDTADLKTRMSLSGTPFENGWLCFESAREKRRLAPIPRDWEFLDPAVLERLCATAERVPQRRRAINEADGSAGAAGAATAAGAEGAA